MTMRTTVFVVDDGTVIDAKEFHKLQTLYLQLMTYVRNM